MDTVFYVIWRSIEFNGKTTSVKQKVDMPVIIMAFYFIALSKIGPEYARLIVAQKDINTPWAHLK